MILRRLLPTTDKQAGTERRKGDQMDEKRIKGSEENEGERGSFKSYVSL